MLIARSPLRVSLGGGGTDLPSYFQKHEGYLIAAAIDKYVYVTITRPFDQGIYLKYSELEKVKNVFEIKHPIIKEALLELKLKTPQVEITTLADIPAGTGLGSSGSFTTALLKGLFTHYHRNIHTNELAELACEIEINRLKEPIGKQDQFISAYGGISEFYFRKDGTVESKRLPLAVETIHDLEDNLVLFFTGFTRAASSILRDQDSKSRKSDELMLENLHFTKEIGFRSKDALVSGNTKRFGELMHEHWEHKKSRSSGMSNEFIDESYTQALQAGAVGGKLVGAGGGGFLMFYANDKEKLRSKMNARGLEEVRFKFDFEGTKVILS